MKRVMTALLLFASASAMADNYHQGYTRKDGTYVQPHYQTAPDRNPYNNYSTEGNVNPYTGNTGNRDPVRVQQQYAPPPNPFNDSSQYQYRQHSKSW